MSSRKIAPEGMVVAPHHLASQSALEILKKGGTAIEAMVAAAATISVVYPHMNSIGSDSFWLIIPPKGEPIAIEACGKAGSLADKAFLNGFKKVPSQGPKSALTVAGTVGGWENALEYVRELGYETQPVKSLLADAIRYAENGFPVSKSQIHAMEYLKISDTEELTDDVLQYFSLDGTIPKVGDRLCQPELANALKLLCDDGLNSFYDGALAKLIVEDFGKKGIPITSDDLKNYKAKRTKPLKLKLKYGDLYNLPPPTQGLVSLAILGMLDELNENGRDESDFIHTCVESVKQAFKLRNKHITDPKIMKIDPEILITKENIKHMANSVTEKASNIENGIGPGDTVWMGCIDNKGFSVSFIQSIYHEFGSAVVLPQTGISWHNRGIAFSLDEDSILSLEPGKLPLHTLNPAAAILNDGRTIVYGSRGGDGQPQSQAAIFHRYVVQGMPLQESISAPRWVYGRTAGSTFAHDLRVEGRFSPEVINNLKQRGHKVVIVEDFSEEVGQVGAVVRHPNGMLEGASDPRCDGAAMGF